MDQDEWIRRRRGIEKKHKNQGEFTLKKFVWGNFKGKVIISARFTYKLLRWGGKKRDIIEGKLEYIRVPARGKLHL